MSASVSVEAFAPLSAQALGLPNALVPPAAQEVRMPVAGRAGAVDAGGPAEGSFGQLVADGIARLNGQLIGDQLDLQKLALGGAPNLHRIMIDLEESRLSFQLMMQVRGRLLEAYQDIMKMPI